MANNNNRRSRRDIPSEVASGVEALIGRLRDEGVANGRAQAEQIVSDAKAQANSIVKQAQQQAEEIVTQAREEAENLKRAAHEALEVAFRDTRLALKTQLTQRFTGEVQRLVGAETQKPEILEKLILEVVGKAKEEVAEAQQVEVLLPRQVAGLAELSRNPEELEQGILTYFIRLVNQDLLREGVNFGVAKDNQGGLKLKLVDQEVVVDLSEQAIAETILEHLQPRFRALLEGMVK
jgi:V/A-type H+-transporting ATPase subunit E